MSLIEKAQARLKKGREQEQVENDTRLINSSTFIVYSWVLGEGSEVRATIGNGDDAVNVEVKKTDWYSGHLKRPKEISIKVEGLDEYAVVDKDGALKVWVRKHDHKSNASFPEFLRGGSFSDSMAYMELATNLYHLPQDRLRVQY